MRPSSLAVAALSLLGIAACAPTAPQGNAGFSHKEDHFSAWTKGRFAEMVTVTNPGKFIAVAGIGAESEEDGHTLYPGDMLNQCRYAYAKIKKALATQGATLADATRMIVFVTDMGGGTRESAKPYRDYVQCKNEAFGDGPLPASTIVQITRLAAPDMLIEINVDAVLPR